MSVTIKAWAIQETDGGRVGKLITIYAPYWHGIKTAIFARKWDAAAYIKNSDQRHRLEAVQVKITIEKLDSAE